MSSTRGGPRGGGGGFGRGGGGAPSRGNYQGGAPSRGNYQGGAPSRGNYQGGASNRGNYQGARGGGSAPYRGGRGGGGNVRVQEDPNPRVMLSMCKLEAVEDVPIFKYDVQVILERDTLTPRDLSKEKFDNSRVFCAKIMAHISETTGEFDDFAYNRAAALYSLTQLNSNEKVYSYNLTDLPEFFDAFGEGTLKVIINAADSFQTSTKGGISEWKSPENNLIEAVNIILEKEAFSRPDLFYSRNAIHYRINDEEAKRLEGAVEVKHGLKTACEIVGTQENPYLAISCDIKNMVLFIHQTLDLTIEAMGVNNPNNTLRNLSVRTTFGDIKKTFTIQDITSKHLVTDKIPGLNITTVQHFQDKYGIKLSKLTLPMVGRKVKDGFIYYPAELLEILPNQTVSPNNLLASHHDAIIRFSAILPELRYHKMMAFMNDLGFFTSKNLLNFGLKLKPEFIAGPCKILKTKVNNAFPWDNASMKLIKFHAQPNFPKWGFVNLGPPEAVNEIMRALAELGVIFTQENSPIMLRVRNSPTGIDILDAAREKGLKYVFVISYMDRNNLHDDLKYNEIDYQIVTQCLTTRVANKMIKSARTMENNLLKVCIKNGGIPFDVEVANPTDLFKIQTNDVLYIGIAFSHQQGTEGKSKNFKKVPSRIGYASTCGKHPLQVLGDYEYIEGHNNENSLQAISGIVDQIRSTFEKNRKRLPRVVCLYVSGFTEAQWEKISTLFTSKLKSVLNGIELMIILASKNSLTRLYRPEVQIEDYSSPDGKAQKANIQPGLFLEAPVFSPAFPTFYLNPHVILQGTAKTAKFMVVLNEPKIQLESIGAVTHALSFLHGVSLSPTAEPAVLTVADRCANRGGNVLKYHMQLNRLKEITVEEANKSLTNPIDGHCHSLRYNA